MLLERLDQVDAAERLYRRSLLQTGGRLSLRQALKGLERVPQKTVNVRLGNVSAKATVQAASVQAALAAAHPGKVLAVHLNYPSRIAQRGRSPQAPGYFLKAGTSLARTGDTIEIDIPGRRIHLAVSDAELEKRRAEENAKGDKAWKPTEERGRVVSKALQAYALMATSADKGAVRDLGQLTKSK